MEHKAIGPGKTALVTGGASGIGLAAAIRFARAGMNVVIVDVSEDRCGAAASEVAEAGDGRIEAMICDVSDRDAVTALAGRVAEAFGGVDVLMCNAGIQPGSDIFDTFGTWEHVIGVNLGGVVNVCQAFVPGMIARGTPGLVINTGSKQGITTPPGDPAYNVSKAGVKVFTEALEHHLRGSGAPVTAHLFVPGYVFTPLTSRGATEKPAGAWTAEETVAFMLERLGEGDFYILCPDNEVTRALDEKRMTWAMGDLTENRPPLSRWHPDWGKAFEAFVSEG